MNWIPVKDGWWETEDGAFYIRRCRGHYHGGCQTGSILTQTEDDLGGDLVGMDGKTFADVVPLMEAYITEINAEL